MSMVWVRTVLPGIRAGDGEAGQRQNDSISLPFGEFIKLIGIQLIELLSG